MNKNIKENIFDNQGKLGNENKIDIPSIVFTAILIIMCIVIPLTIRSNKVEDSWYHGINKGIVEEVYTASEDNTESDIQYKRDLPIEVGSGISFIVDRKRSDDISDISDYLAISYAFSDIEVKTSGGDTLYNSYNERHSAYKNESRIRKHMSMSGMDNIARREKFEIIRIPSEYKGRYIEITLNPIKDSDVGIVTNIYSVNNLMELITVIFLREVHLIVPSVFMIFIGFTGVLVYTAYRLFKREYVNILYLTHIAGITGLVLLCQTDFIKSFLPSELNTIHYVLYISTQLINIPIIKYIVTRFGLTLDYKNNDTEDYKHNKWNKVISVSGRLLIVLTVLNSIIQFILSINGYISYIDTIYISVFLTVLTSLVFVLTGFMNRDKLYIYEKYFYASIFVMNSLSMINENFLKFHIFSYVLSIEIVMFIVFLISVALKYFDNIKKEKIHFSLLDEALKTDNLTKLGSRHAYERRLFELNKANKKCVIMFVDLNNLKFINDKLGHEYGDRAIKGVAEYLKNKFPDSDIFRIGGDEYVIISQDYSDYNKLSKLESKEVFVQGVTEHIPVVMSFGVAFYDPANLQNETIEDYVKRADKAMYRNKQKYKEKNPQWSYRVFG
ncbi:MAG: GGDEF domain-containing protein [Ruminococcaceae bacterium]|nr:GGDEF domain-containing protein [Oscillospiraceae bacterium]